MLAVEQDKRRQDEKTGQILFISHFINEGQYLLFVNPGKDATEKEIEEWKFKVRKWVQDVSGYLWAIPNTKFNDLMNRKSTDFHGAHESIWAELSFLETRLNNLKEIIEKRDIYLAAMG